MQIRRLLIAVSMIASVVALVIATTTSAQATGTTDPQAAYPTCNTSKEYASGNDRGGLTHLPVYSGTGTRLCVMARGAQHWGVVVLQVALKNCNGAGRDFPIDGIYGSRTEAVVRWIQAANRITADGIYGPRTLSVLNWPIRHGSLTHCHRFP